MAKYACRIGSRSHAFADLRTLLACATPLRSGDQLAGIAAESDEQRVAARMVLADLPLSTFLSELVIPYETDEVTRLIIDSHDAAAFTPIRGLSVGEFREWLLRSSDEEIQRASAGITPEMAAAVSKLMRNIDLISVAAKLKVVTAFRNTQGLPGRLGTRLQPNHPTDSLPGIWASTLDGLLFGMGDAVIGINPASDNVSSCIELLKALDDFRARFEIPSQSCVLAHITTTLAAIEAGAPVDLMFQSVAGTEAANQGFGISLSMLREGLDATRSLNRGTLGDNVMYFETGQGSALSADAHHGVDQQTLEARAYGVCRAFSPPFS